MAGCLIEAIKIAYNEAGIAAVYFYWVRVEER
jgi:hypothetical protein